MTETAFEETLTDEIVIATIVDETAVVIEESLKSDVGKILDVCKIDFGKEVNVSTGSCVEENLVSFIRSGLTVVSLIPGERKTTWHH